MVYWYEDRRRISPFDLRGMFRFIHTTSTASFVRLGLVKGVRYFQKFFRLENAPPSFKYEKARHTYP